MLNFPVIKDQIMKNSIMLDLLRPFWPSNTELDMLDLLRPF